VYDGLVDSVVVDKFSVISGVDVAVIFTFSAGDVEGNKRQCDASVPIVSRAALLINCLRERVRFI
jgi:hypothetical protein